MTTTQTKYKVNDVYSFRYKEEIIKDWFEPYHCFDGQLIVTARANGSLYLVDTYWGSSDMSRVFSITKAEEQGILTFKCNLDEVEDISKHDLPYYADEDVFDLSSQHGCYKKYVKRKGAVRSQAKMLQSAREKLEEMQHELRSAQWKIERLTESIAKIEAGDTTVYI